MQIILLDKIVNLGDFGDQVNVKSGYARNFLIPRGKAVQATKENIEYFKARRIEYELKLAKDLEIAKVRAEKINTLGIITITSKAGEEGKLFGSVGIREIVDAVTAAGITISKKEVYLPNGSLRNVGEHEVGLRFHSEIFTKLTVRIITK